MQLHMKSIAAWLQQLLGGMHCTGNMNIQNRYIPKARHGKKIRQKLVRGAVALAEKKGLAASLH